jgi:hypothetical protein
MSENPSITGSGHPAPQRARAPYVALAFGLFAPPIGWVLRLLVNYSIAGQYCAGAAFTAAAPGSDDTLSMIFFVDLIAVVLAIAGGYIAFELWERTRQETEGGAHHLVQSGKGRTRFLAMCGMLTSILFGLAVIFDVIGVMVGPPC